VAEFSADVSNDPNNYGVDWSVSCQGQSNCGTLSTIHTDSGGSVTYTPPPTLSSNSASVTIIAFATADHSKNVTAPLTITAFGSSLQGTYVFAAKGSDSGSLAFQVAGVVILDGNGGITSGQQTLNSGVAGGSSTTAVLSTSSYFIGGAVVYSNAMKEKWAGVRPDTLRAHGAVSKEVAIELAEGVRRAGEATYGLSITGIAGPSGGTPDKPVGTTHFALATQAGTHWQQQRMLGDRERIRLFAAAHALDMLRRHLLGVGV